MQHKPSNGSRRPAGTGSLFTRTDVAGRETWYGKVWIGQRQVKRRLGRRREPGGAEGLGRREAEAALRHLVAEIHSAPPPDVRLSFAEVAERYVRHVEVVRERKATTVADYRGNVRRHLAPFFAGRAIEAVTPDLVDSYMAAKRAEGLSTKTIANQLTLLHGIFAWALKKGWVRTNPVAAVDRPTHAGGDPDIRFFEREELEALIRAVPADELGATEGVLYLAAAMTGLRQGELVALRWRDVDWTAGQVRVRRTYTRGEYTTPKSRRSSRAVPLADRLAGELETHFQRSEFRGDDDLVFAHPIAGGPYDASRMRKRYKDALSRAGLRPLRFHDLRHTFGTQMAAAGAPLRAIQEWMGHRDYRTTSIYADHAPDPSNGRRWAEAAFGESRNAPENALVTGDSDGRFGAVSRRADSGS